MASDNGKQQDAESAPEENATAQEAGNEQAANGSGKRKTGSDKYGRSVDLHAYRSLAGSAAIVGRAVQNALNALNTTSVVLLLDDWNYLKGGILLEKVSVALSFHLSNMDRNAKAIEAGLESADAMQAEPKELTPDTGEQQNEAARETAPADFSSILANLKSLHEWLQPSIEYAVRDLTFDADAVRSAVAGALASPSIKVEVFIPSLRQIDMNADGMQLMKQLQQAMNARDDLAQKLDLARRWIEGHADSPKKPVVEQLVNAGDEIAKAFDTYADALLKEKPSVLEQALIQEAANSINATHLLAVKPVLAVSETTNVRAFPLMNENRQLGASVLTYTLTEKNGKVRAAGIADASIVEKVQPHRANQLLAWLLGAIAVLLALFLLFGAGTLSLAGFRALMIAVNPPVTATVAPTATPMPTQLPAKTPQAAPGG